MSDWLEVRCASCRKRTNGTLLARIVAGSLTAQGLLEFKCHRCHTMIVVTDDNAMHEDYVATFPDGFFRRGRVMSPAAVPLST